MPPKKKGGKKGKRPEEEALEQEAAEISGEDSDDGKEEQSGGEAVNSAPHQSEEEDGHASEGGASEHEPDQQERREGHATFATLVQQIPAAMRQQQTQEQQSLGEEAVAAATTQVLNKSQTTTDKALPAQAVTGGVSCLVNMTTEQYQAFLQFTKQQQQPQKVIPAMFNPPQRRASGGNARATPTASSATLSAFRVNSQGLPEEREVVLIDSDGERNHHVKSPPPKKSKAKSSSSSSSSERQKTVTITSPKKGGAVKSPGKALATIRCPNCGDEDSTHVHILCRVDRRTDLVPSRSTAELNFLKQLDVLRRAERVKDKLVKQQLAEAEGDGESVHSEERSEEEDEEAQEDEQNEEFLDDDSSYVPSSASLQPVAESLRHLHQALSRKQSRPARFAWLLQSRHALPSGISLRR